MLDFAHVAKNLADFGLETVSWVPCRGSGSSKYELGGGKARPLVRVIPTSESLKTFREKWPNADQVILSALDGSSIRVQNQEPVRKAVEKDRNASDHDVIVTQLHRMAKVRTVRFGGGPALSTASDDALVAEFAKRRGIDLETARGLMIDAGLIDEPEAEEVEEAEEETEEEEEVEE